ncbi:MAG TPA: 50S ribosomal protein L9 [Candidatus Pacearchaeota archaeon]|jgi:large subunit ribosomal protein L9|nr:50S ribosomal protein L9 [Candidatus Pacearchaeota archaeon]HPZ74520.1 50S ribosomal protein L9 [Candidatus Pacearchaeota archaeon]HQD89115.1 50S ribosomal protein L9 [Candidatus Pacearchaeota archaeon]
MKIILLKDVPNLGKELDIKDVKPGYARNFLIPQNLVVPATKRNLQWQERELAKKKLREEQKTKELQEMIKKLKNLKLQISVKTGSKGELFEKITSIKIVNLLKKEGFEMSKENIIFKEPIEKIGEYVIPISLGKDFKTKIKLVVKKKK